MAYELHTRELPMSGLLMVALWQGQVTITAAAEAIARAARCYGC